MSGERQPHTIKCEETGQRETFALVNVTVNIGFNLVNSSQVFELLLFSSLVNEMKEQERKEREHRGSVGH